MGDNRNVFIIAGVGIFIIGVCALLVLGGVFLYPQIVETDTGAVVNIPAEEATVVVVPETQLVIEPVQTELPPQVELPSTEVPVEAPPTIDYAGISFSFGPQIAQGVTPQTVPAAPGDAANSFPGDVHPAYEQFNFDGYVLQDRFHDPVLIIYPVGEYGAMDPAAAQVFFELEQVLVDKPATRDRFPFLPRWNAAQMLQAQVKYLEFTNGTGVRFLTQYGQAVWPINNISMFYTFQGLTSDGNWYVVALLPASHPNLPDNDQDVPGGDFMAFEQQYESYINTTENMLSTQPEGSFLPGLDVLDAMIVSLKVK